MEREVRYCTTEDGVRIAYCVEGDGPPLLALPMFIESFSLDHLMPEHRQFLRDIAQGHQLIRFDIRGVGLSEKDADDESPEAIIRDGEAVLKACNVKQVVFWASTATGPYALEWALRHPRRMTKLVLYGTCSRLEDAIPAATLKAFAAMCGANWALASQALADMTGRRALPDAALKLAKWFHESSSGPFVERLILQNSDHNFGNRLREVKVPTLIVHRLEDPAFPFEVAQAMAAQIPGSRFVPLSGAAHLPFFGDAEQIVDVVTAFLNEGTEPRTPRRRRVSASRAVVRTVLFTDLVGHTEMMSRLGDERGRDVLREHETITRNVLKQHGGTEVKTMGDGFLASFSSVTKAVECAVALQQAFTAREGEPLSVRVGLNAGEPIEENGDLFGATVILASRIAAKAEGGEILVADTVRGLCSGKGFLFADRGEFVAKGFEEPVRVSEVNWHHVNAS